MANMLFQDKAWKNLIYWAFDDQKTLKKIQDLLQDIARGGYEGIGKPEPLNGDLSGLWSRRIDKQNRPLYRVDGNAIEIASCKGRYEDK